MSKLDDLLTKLAETSIQKFRESAIYNKLKMQAEGYDKEFVDVWLESMELSYAKGCADVLIDLSEKILHSPQDVFDNLIDVFEKQRAILNERN